jgi:hypothetical protein
MPWETQLPRWFGSSAEMKKTAGDSSKVRSQPDARWRVPVIIEELKREMGVLLRLNTAFFFVMSLSRPFELPVVREHEEMRPMTQGRVKFQIRCRGGLTGASW